jgi:hypothetical protein
MVTGVFGSLVDIKKHYKYILVVLILGCSFFVGRYTAPTKTITQTVTLTEKAKVDTIQNQEVKTQIQYVDRPVDHVITKTVIKEVGGKVTETVTDATHTGNTVVNRVEDAKTQVKTEIKTEIVYKDKIVEKLILKDFKKWEVGAHVGYQLTGDGINIIPSLPKKMEVGVSVDRSLNEWLSVGVWANSSTAVGAGLHVRF